MFPTTDTGRAELTSERLRELKSSFATDQLRCGIPPLEAAEAAEVRSWIAHLAVLQGQALLEGRWKLLANCPWLAGRAAVHAKLRQGYRELVSPTRAVSHAGVISDWASNLLDELIRTSRYMHDACACSHADLPGDAILDHVPSWRMALGDDDGALAPTVVRAQARLAEVFDDVAAWDRTEPLQLAETDASSPMHRLVLRSFPFAALPSPRDPALAERATRVMVAASPLALWLLNESWVVGFKPVKVLGAFEPDVDPAAAVHFAVGLRNEMTAERLLGTVNAMST